MNVTLKTAAGILNPKRLIAATLLTSLIPFLLLTKFVRPAFDDYTWSVLTLTRGYFSTQWHLYSSYNGRYFGTALLTFSPLNYGSVAAYKAIAFVIILLTGLSIFFFVRSVLGPTVAVIDKVIAGAFLWALFSNQTPDITEAYFWLTGDLYYQLGGILTLVFFGLVVRESHQRSRKLAVTVIGSLLIAAIAGSNETSMVILCVLVFVISLHTWWRKSAARWQWLIFAVVAAVCSSILVLAPGNAVRSLSYPGRHRLFFSLGMSLVQEARFLLAWLTNTSFVLATLFFIPLAARFSARVDLLKRARVHPVMASVVLMTIVFTGFFLPYWGTGLLGQHRTVNTVYFIFVIGWFVTVAAWVVYCKEKYAVGMGSMPRFAYWIGAPLLVATLFVTNNTREAIADLVSLRAYRYDRAASVRDATLEQCAREGIKDCRKTPIDNLPTSITNPYFEKMIESEPQYWKIRASSSAPN